MKANFQFSNLCGTVYRQGNVVFTPDGNSILSPVGNRVSVFDLVNNVSRTLPFENRKNIVAIDLSPDSNCLLSVDEDGRCLFVNFRRSTVLHHHNFHAPVNCVKFSPDGRYIAVTHKTHVQLWKTPNALLRAFAPFELHRTYTGHHDEVLGVHWAPDSTCFISTSRDMTARMFTVNPLEGFRPLTFAGHRDAVVGAYIAKGVNEIYTVSHDGAVFTWRSKLSASDEDTDDEIAVKAPASLPLTRWGIAERHYFSQGASVSCSVFHAGSSLLIVGFTSGVFGLWSMPSFERLHTLSIGAEKISAVSVTPSGEWLAFGARKAGALLVWEWQSESYVLKQQAHAAPMRTLAYATDGAHIATGGDDGRVKLWDSQSGFCIVTFSEHTASVSGVEFGASGKVLFSSSLDGTVRAFDLIRYRNFRTFTSPSPRQFACLAVDPAAEVVAAGAADDYEVFLWSVQTGKLLDVLAGHEGPVSCLGFSPTTNVLASASWDKTVRVWNVFGRSHAVEPFTLTADALALAWRPDGRELAVATLDGQITILDPAQSKQTNVIDGRRDLGGARKAGDRVTAANASGSRTYCTLTYSADGTCLLAGGNSPKVVLYDVRGAIALKTFTVSQNFSLAGTQDFLDSRHVIESGNVDLVDERDEDSDVDRGALTLPGKQGGDLGKRRTPPSARTTCVRFSPTGHSWAAASPEGLLIYSLDNAPFDPADLALDLTPASILTLIDRGEIYRALVASFRLSEKPLIVRAYEAVPVLDIRLVAREMPERYVRPLLELVAERLHKGPHLEFDALWAQAVLVSHGKMLRLRSGEYASVFRGLLRGLGEVQRSVSKLCNENDAMLSFILDQSASRAAAEVS